ENWKLPQVKSFSQNHLFAAGIFGADRLGEGAGERTELGKHLELVKKAFRSLDVHKPGNALCHFIKPVHAQSEGHAAFAAELVDKNLVARVALDVFKQQGGSAGGVLRRRVSSLPDGLA